MTSHQQTAPNAPDVRSARLLTTSNTDEIPKNVRPRFARGKWWVQGGGGGGFEEQAARERLGTRLSQTSTNSPQTIGGPPAPCAALPIIRARNSPFSHRHEAPLLSHPKSSHCSQIQWIQTGSLILECTYAPSMQNRNKDIPIPVPCHTCLPRRTNDGPSHPPSMNR